MNSSTQNAKCPFFFSHKMREKSYGERINKYYSCVNEYLSKINYVISMKARLQFLISSSDTLF